jgi:hypothetical protein
MTRETKLGIGVSAALLILVALAIVRAWFGPEASTDNNTTEVAASTSSSDTAEEKTSPSSTRTPPPLSKEGNSAVVPADFKVPETASHPGKLPDSLTASAASPAETAAAPHPLPPAPTAAPSSAPEPVNVPLPEPTALPLPTAPGNASPAAPSEHPATAPSHSPLQIAQAATSPQTEKPAPADNEGKKPEARSNGNSAKGANAVPSVPAAATTPDKSTAAEKKASDLPLPPAPPTGVAPPLPPGPPLPTDKTTAAGNAGKGNNPAPTTEELLSQQKAKAEQQSRPPNPPVSLPGPAPLPAPPASAPPLPGQNGASASEISPRGSGAPGVASPDKASLEKVKGIESLPGSSPATSLPGGPGSLPGSPASPSPAPAVSSPGAPPAPVSSPAALPPAPPASAPAPATGVPSLSGPIAPPTAAGEGSTPAAGSAPAPVATGPSLVVAGGNTPSAPLPQVRNYSVETFLCTPEVRTFAAISRLKYGTEAYAHALWVYNRDWPGGEALREENALLPVGQRILVPPVSELERLTGSTPPPAPSPAAPSGVASSPAGPGSWPAPVAASPMAPPVPVAPSLPAATPPVALGRPSTDRTVTYQVRPGGEMLYEIARERLGDGRRWSEIYRLNPHIVPEQPVPGGTLLRLPADARLTP